MQRRTLLSSLTAVGTVAIAGCSNSSTPASGPESTQTEEASDPESTQTEERPQEPLVVDTNVETAPLRRAGAQVRNPTDEIVERKLWIQLVSKEGEPLERRSKIVQLVPTSNSSAAAIPFEFTEVAFSGGDIDIDSTKTALTATDAEPPGEMEQTGVEFTESSDKVDIGKVVGKAADEGKKIKFVNMPLRLAAGSDPIDLKEMMYTISTPTKTTSIRGNPNEMDGLSFRRYQSLENDTTILADQRDLMIVEFDLTNISGVNPIGEASEIVLVAQSPTSVQSWKYAQTPSNIYQDEGYIL